MTKLKILNAKQMERLLFDLGFKKARQKGSHAFYRHTDGRVTIIPHHPGDLPRPIIRSILKDINLSPDEFEKILCEN